MMNTVTLLFDYLSPFAYFAHYKLTEIEDKANVTIIQKPVVFAGILNHWGQKGPAEISPKRTDVFRQCLYYADNHQIPFTMPKYHPFNPITALRLSLEEVSGSSQNDVITALWQAAWQQGQDISDSECLRHILKSIGLSADDLLNKTQETAVKQQLKVNTEDAIQKGVFGVPTFLYDDQTFWGADSIPELLDYITNEYRVDQRRLQTMLDTPSAVSRK